MGYSPDHVIESAEMPRLNILARSWQDLVKILVGSWQDLAKISHDLAGFNQDFAKILQRSYKIRQDLAKMFNLGRINPQDPLSYSLQLEYIILNMLFYSQNLPANTMYLIPKCWSWAWSLACHGTSQWWVFNKFLKYCKCPAVLRSYVTPCNVSCKLSCNADNSKNQPKQKQCWNPHKEKDCAVVCRLAQC